MTAKTRVLVLFMIDVAIIWFNIVTSYLFRFYNEIPPEYVVQMIVFGVISTVAIGEAWSISDSTAECGNMPALTRLSRSSKLL